jgi:hypothetical protein
VSSAFAAQPLVFAQRLLLWAANVKGSSKQKKTAPGSGLFLFSAFQSHLPWAGCLSWEY